MKVKNLSRHEVRELKDWNNSVWVSIQEPEDEKSVVLNPFALEKNVPTLRISFWDLTREIEFMGDILYPPSSKDAEIVLSFILNNPDKDIVVNCAAGVSRSGAVAKFCHDFLGYEWPIEYKKRADSNSVLYSEMAKCLYRLRPERCDVMEFDEGCMFFPKLLN